tara:strand:+ start:2293 stop:2868 length:576 start_codon:yes stop_codon:yes gene_type:complete
MTASIKENLKQCILWATIPLVNGLTYEVKKTTELTVKQQRDNANLKEKEWGNLMIEQKNNGNWTTLLGEGLVYEVLNILGKNPRKPDKKSGYEPDWETDEYIYEVKTRNWTTSGTAGEKVPAVMYKYSDIPQLYGKPLRIVCVGYQEWELTNGNTKIFGEVSVNKRKFLDLARSMEIEFIKFSDLVSKINL